MPALTTPSHLSAGQLGGALRNTVGLRPGAGPMDGRGHKHPPSYSWRGAGLWYQVLLGWYADRYPTPKPANWG